LQSIKFIKVYITGITLQSRKYGASRGSHVVFVEGIDRRKETDENGWFQIQVEDRASFTVRAIFEGYVAAAEVKQRKLRESVRLILQPGPSSKPNSDFSLSKTNSDYSPVEINFRNGVHGGARSVAGLCVECRREAEIAAAVAVLHVRRNSSVMTLRSHWCAGSWRLASTRRQRVARGPDW